MADFDYAMDLVNKAYDAMRELQDDLTGNGMTDDARKAANICHQILFLQMSIQADEHYGK